jgi:hypothetical protein
MIRGRYKNWRKWRKTIRGFPVRWLTYKQRVREDLDVLWKAEGAEEFFGSDYVAKLADAARQLEGWQIKLMVTQTAVVTFLALGFLSRTAAPRPPCARR